MPTAVLKKGKIVLKICCVSLSDTSKTNTNIQIKIVTTGDRGARVALYHKDRQNQHKMKF